MTAPAKKQPGHNVVDDLEALGGFFKKLSEDPAEVFNDAAGDNRETITVPAEEPDATQPVAVPHHVRAVPSPKEHK